MNEKTIMINKVDDNDIMTIKLHAIVYNQLNKLLFFS